MELKEKNFWNSICDKIPGDVLRIETFTTNGVPDVNFCYQGHEGWIELKVAKGPRTFIRKEQYAWCLSRSVHHKGRIFVLSKMEGGIAGWQFPNVDVAGASQHIYISNQPAMVFTEKGEELKQALKEFLTCQPYS